MQKILVIQTAFIGDVVLATPVVEQLCAHFPERAVDVLVRKGNEELFAHHPRVRAVLTWQKSTGKYRHLWRVLRRVRSQRYDLVVNLQRHLSMGLLTVFSGAAMTVGFDKNPLSFLFRNRVPHTIGSAAALVHEVERNLSLIRFLIGDVVQKPVLYLPPARRDPPYRPAGPYLCIAPGTTWLTKRLPSEKWIGFIGRVGEEWQVLLLGSKGERALCEAIRQRAGRNGVHNLAGRLSLLESAALMKGAAMNYVHDSAPLHLASAVDAPVTAVFCSTVPSFGFGPLSTVAHLVETSENLACRPCGLHGHGRCPKRHFRCANLSVEALLDKLP